MTPGPRRDGRGPGPRRRLAVVVVAVVVATVAVAPPATTGRPGPNATAPGARLAGAAAVGAVEAEAAVAAEAFAARFAAAETDAARADVVVSYLADANRSLDALERRSARLARARTNGSMDAGERAARYAAVAAGARAALRVANRSEAAAASLPPALRRARSIPERVRTVRRRADALLSVSAARSDPGANATTAPDPDHAAPLSLDDVVAAYEAGAGGAPADLRRLVGTERVVVVVRRADGTAAAFTLRTRDGRVVDAARGRSGNATLRVYTTHAVVRAVRDADDPWPVLRRALAGGRVRYDGVGPANTLKFGAVSLAQGLADALRGM